MRVEESLDKESHGNDELVRRERGKTVMKNRHVAEGEEGRNILEFVSSLPGNFYSSSLYSVSLITVLAIVPRCKEPYTAY